MTEHVAQARRPAEPVGSDKAPVAAAPAGHHELLSPRSEALAGYAQLLAPRGGTTLSGCAQLLARRATANARAAPAPQGRDARPLAAPSARSPAPVVQRVAGLEAYTNPASIPADWVRLARNHDRNRAGRNDDHYRALIAHYAKQDKVKESWPRYLRELFAAAIGGGAPERSPAARPMPGEAASSSVAARPVAPEQRPSSAPIGAEAPRRESPEQEQPQPSAASSAVLTDESVSSGSQADHGASAHRVTPVRDQAEAASSSAARPATDGDPIGRMGMKRQTITRIGFEIDASNTVFAMRVDRTPEARADAAKLVNQTIATFSDRDGPLLEMLLDDMKGGRILRFEAEFRTVPLELEMIGPSLKRRISAAIASLRPARIFSREPLAPGWERSAACDRALGLGMRHETGEFSSKVRAQHVTSSINLGAFPGLSREMQRSLYPQGEGARSKKLLYGAMTRSLGQAIDASASGRDAAGTTVKTPLETLLAAERAERIAGADESFDAVNDHDRAPSVSVDGSGPVGRVRPLETAIGQIISANDEHRGAFPTMQGVEPDGTERTDDRPAYRAHAEKLQPPLLDPTNHELRVLVEHRTDPLRDAVNRMMMSPGEVAAASMSAQAAAAQKAIWTDFVAAAREMDRRAQRQGMPAPTG